MSKHRLVVVGGSLAGLRAAETARKLGFAGQVTMISAEPGLPYDRPPLSKAYLTGGDVDVTIRDRDTLRGLEIDLRAGVRATSLDVENDLVVGMFVDVLQQRDRIVDWRLIKPANDIS